MNDWLGLIIQFAILLLVITVVLGVLSLILSAIAKPKGKDLEFLTSSAPNERLLQYRVCNACVKNAEPNAFVTLVMNATGANKGADPVFALIRKMTGGLWVGGRVFLTTHRILFVPNALNRAAHKSLSNISLRLPDVTDVVCRFGVSTKIVDIVTPVGSLTVRGYKMKEFANTIEEARKGA